MQKHENAENGKMWNDENHFFAIKKWGGRFRPKNRVPWYPLELKKCRTRRLGFHKVSKSAIYLTFWGFLGFVTFSLFLMFCIFCFCHFWWFWFCWFCHFLCFSLFDDFDELWFLIIFCHFLCLRCILINFCVKFKCPNDDTLFL